MQERSRDPSFPGTNLSRWIATGLASGAVAVLLFHQGAAAALRAWGVIPNAPFAMEPTASLHLTVLWSMLFWGAVWGALVAATLSRLHGAKLVLTATAFGAVFPTLVAWLLAAPLAERSIAVGLALLLNALWGFGTGLGLALFGRARHESLAGR